MIINWASRLLVQLLLPGLENLLSNSSGEASVAYSPVTYSLEKNLPGGTYGFEIYVRTARREYSLLLFYDTPSKDLYSVLFEKLSEGLPAARAVLRMILRRDFQIEYRPASDSHVRTYESEVGRYPYRIDISVIHGNTCAQLVLFMPSSFLRLLTGRRGGLPDAEEAERVIINYFQDTARLFPRLPILLEELSALELQRLISDLLKRNLLSLYQICLITLAFPEHSLAIKNSLSSTMVKDAGQMIGVLRSRRIVTARDLAEGVYSVEESIHRLLRPGESLSYSGTLSCLREIRRIMSSMEVLLVRDFMHWMGEFYESGLLYHTISLTGEIDTARALAGLPEQVWAMLQETISIRQVEEIRALLSTDQAAFADRLAAQSRMIGVYRKLKIRRLRPSQGSLERLLISFARSSDYNRFLFEAGWFVISTAFKGMKPDIARRVLDNLPVPARWLIEDVTRGVVNPNIFHDEIQINKARSLCVRSILSLYEGGAILLSI